MKNAYLAFGVVTFMIMFYIASTLEGQELKVYLIGVTMGTIYMSFGALTQLKINEEKRR